MKESRGITPLRTILQNCLNHIENLETNRSICDNYDKEFQDLKQFSETLKIQKEFSCTEGEKEVNRKKNRYKDILPFNISRVVLSEYAGIPGSDYINANYIKGASGSPAYIASQGPLPNTVDDFWRMVVECEVQVIVMACNAQESGKHKCENYWVEKEGEEKRFGMVQICLVKASTVCPDFLVRTMRLKYTNDKDVIEERTICQFHYSAWPDHGVPPLVRPLLDMVRLMRDTQASETLPVLVHCSAGCGRTGTICAIDFVWGLLRAGKLTEEFSLFNLVKDMRKQRVAMVQTKEQYILVHQAVRELFEEQLRVIESHPYENIDFNGVPLIKDFDEPFYETICVRSEDSCEEKQDKSEVKEKGEESDIKINKINNAPPLPRKKRANVLFSKQEKEAENLTEKNRIFFAEKEKTDATLSSLLGKPRIVKLRALFEKSPSVKDRSLKDRGSQTVSRSLSLGAIRKPLPTEIFESQNDKSKPSCSTSQSSTSEVAKLKHSKSFSKSVPLIKRSKSLKTFNQSSRLIVSPSNNNTHKIFINSPKVHETDSNLKIVAENSQLQSRKIFSQDTQQLKDCSKRRRSLESLMGDIPLTITWPTTVIVMEKCSNHTGKQVCDCPTKSEYQVMQNHKNVDLLRQPLQHLSLETERKMNNFVPGIGIRERRNSFRQAVTKNDVYNVFGNCQQCHCLDTKKSSDFCAPLNSKINNNINVPSLFSSSSDAKYLEPDASTQAKANTKKIPNAIDENKLKLQKQQSSLNAGSQVNRIITKDSHQQDTSSMSINPSLLQHRMCQVKSKNSRPCEDFEKNMESKNLFLKKLNSEILSEREKEVGHITQESNIRYRRSKEDSDKPSPHIVHGFPLANSISRKPLHKTKIVLTGSYNTKADVTDETDSSSSRNIISVEVEKTEKVFQPSRITNLQKHHVYIQPQKSVKSVERFERCSNAQTSQSNFYHRAGHLNVDSFGHHRGAEISHAFRRNEPISVNQNDTQHKDPYLPILQKQNVCCVSPKTVSSSLKSADFSGNYSKNCKIPESDFYDKNKSNYSDKKFVLPSEIPDKSSKSYSSWSHSPSCRSCESSSSDQPSSKSESSKLLGSPESSYSAGQDKKNIKKTKQVSEQNKNYVNDSAKTMHDLESYISPRKQTGSELSSQGNNLKQNTAKHSKDDFILEEPIAPPRIKRHASITVPRNNLNGANNVSIWISAENKNRSNRNSKLQSDETAWNDSFGIDLDAVAASLEKDKRDTPVLHKMKPADNHLRMTMTSNPQKKQHYF